MAFKPNGDRVLIDLTTSPDKTKGGLFIPQDARQKPITGRVVAVGPGIGCPNCGVNHLRLPEVGEYVLFNETAGTDIGYAGKEYRLLRAADIHGYDPEMFGEKSDHLFLPLEDVHAPMSAPDPLFVPGVAK